MNKDTDILHRIRRETKDKDPFRKTLEEENGIVAENVHTIKDDKDSLNRTRNVAIQENEITTGNVIEGKPDQIIKEDTQSFHRIRDTNQTKKEDPNQNEEITFDPNNPRQRLGNETNEGSQMTKEGEDNLHRIRRHTYESNDFEDNNSSSVEEIKYDPNIKNPYDDPRHPVHKYFFKRNRQEEKSEMEWMNATRERIEEEARKESKMKTDYKWRTQLEETLFELGKRGNFSAIEALTDQMEKAQKLQDEFLKSLEEAGKKANRTLVTPLPDNPVPGHHQHMDHLRYLKEYMIRKRAQGVSDRTIIGRVSDKMMEYWFNFLGNQTIANMTGAARTSTPHPTTPELMKDHGKVTPESVRSPFSFFNTKHSPGSNKAYIYITLLLVINASHLNAHENNLGELVGEAEIQEGITEESSEMNAETDILHRIRRDINQTKEEIKPTIEAEVKFKKEEHRTISVAEELLKQNQTEDQLKKRFADLTKKEKEELIAKMDEVIKAKEEAALRVKKEEQLQAKRKEALKRNKFFLNPRKEKELRAKLEGKGIEKEENRKNRENAKPKKEEELTTNKTNAEAKTNQTDANKISWSTIKSLAQNYPQSEFKFRHALEGQMRNLQSEGDLINLKKLTDKFKKAFEFSDAFHKILGEASDKKIRITLSPIQKEHYGQIMKIKGLTDKLKEKGIPERKAAYKASDRMLEYWFKYVEETEASTGAKPNNTIV
ncbi:hypothetical protein WDU94_002927 [Cyamophila willieti]